MKKPVAVILLFTMFLLLSACNKNSEQISDSNTDSIGGFLADSETGQEYSDNMLIITVPPETPEKDIKDLLDRYSMKVVYEMPNLSMYTVELSHSVTAEEMDKLIGELEENDIILGASKNYINRLD